MSFGTFTLFSFLQQPNTGIIPAGGPTSGEANALINSSGHVADFVWSFPYLGTAIPIDVAEGIGGQYRLNLFSDYNAPGTDGLHYATAMEIISGQLTNGNVENGNIFIGASGSFYPMDSGQTFSSFVLSGAILPSPPDIQNNFLFLSGGINGLQTDFPCPNVILSGLLVNASPDFPKINCIFSGNLIAGNVDNSSVSMSFKGSFVPVYSDKANITYRFTGFSSLLNITVNNLFFEDQCNITYGFGGFTSTKG
jgi:hypothetical protein